MFYKLKGVSSKSGKGTVSVLYRQTNFETLKSTGVKVAPGDFNTKTGKVKPRVPEHPELNAQIQDVVTCLEMAVRDIAASGRMVTKEGLDSQYLVVQSRLLLSREGQVKTDLIGESVALKPIPDESNVKPAAARRGKKGTKLTDKIAAYLSLNPENYSENTILGYEDLRGLLTKFNLRLTIEEVNLAMFQEFQSYLIKKGLRNQSIRVSFARLKKVYTYYAEEMGLPMAFITKFKMVRELYNDNVVFLSQEEVARIEEVDLRNKAQDHIRWQFLFSCEVGLRHSDLYITAANVKSTELHVTMQKSKHTVKPPLTAKAKAILASEHFPFKPRCINQYNKVLRVIARKAGLTEIVTQTHFVGNKPLTETKQKWELISSHVGRKTAINNWLNRGVRESVVALWAGHQNAKMIQKHYQNRDAASAAEAKKLE